MADEVLNHAEVERLRKALAETEAERDYFYDALAEHARVIAAIETRYTQQGQYNHELVRRLNDAMEIAEAVAESGGEYYWAGDNICLYCKARTLAGVTGLEDDHVTHTSDCPVTKARALLTA